MTKKKLTNEFMEKVLNDSAWKELSGDFQWTEQMLVFRISKQPKITRNIQA